MCWRETSSLLLLPFVSLTPLVSSLPIPSKGEDRLLLSRNLNIVLTQTLIYSFMILAVSCTPHGKTPALQKTVQIKSDFYFNMRNM